MRVRTLNVRVTFWLFTWLDASIVTDWDKTNSEGVPSITPVDGFRDRPIGSDPDVMENKGSDPLIVGEIETDSSFARA